ncbi:hypothetical protein H206_05141 [Candidatus Electrothrix aarhusensis]|uniref:Nucleotidyltransferase domain-containing protein n=1 Tax=Candidatus Electrothrix aarhusensis TaxID=1859131 RepID=A0A444J5J5_9BACT|nr:hypothetical protein H206_05141 [Candidatus Electrothrix aarhusensis]
MAAGKQKYSTLYDRGAESEPGGFDLVLILFSRVRNEARQDSDWDILIIADHLLEKPVEKEGVEL